MAWLAPLELSKFNLAGNDSVAFQGDYVRATWDGDLVAYDLSSQGVFTVKWRARNQVPAPDSRNIFTSSASGTGVAFRWSGNSRITDAQKLQLGNGTGNDNPGAKVLGYLRGDTANELSPTQTDPTAYYRTRYSKLGAIIHSRPYFSDGVVYVGANDGMLHAFDASGGTELFAYVPSMLFAGSRLKSLASPNTSDFPYQVDGPLAIGTVGTEKVLVGGLGAGAAGLFALTITNPRPATEAVAAQMARWEITPATGNFSNLGQVMSAPKIAKLNNGTTAVLVSNGIDSAGKVSSLFVIDASTGARIKEIPAGTALADGSANGLGAIAAVDTDGNGTVDVVYAGDLGGTLWKFDLSSSSFPNAATALYAASTAADKRPITAAPSVSLHPRGGLLVNFGTGKVYKNADLSSTEAEYLHGLWDNGSTSGLPLNPSNLVLKTLTTRTWGSQQVRTASDEAVSYTGSNRGWRIGLSGGERLLGNDLTTDNGQFTVTTTIPNGGAQQSAWLTQVSALSGGAPLTPFFDLDGDNTINVTNNSDRISVTGGGTSNVLVPVAKFLGTGAWSQPVLGQVNDTQSLPFFNSNPNQVFPAYTTQTTTTYTNGVSDGHFDFDIFYQCGTAAINRTECSRQVPQTHVHEYDDKWNVVGVNLLNPSFKSPDSTSEFNLNHPIPSDTTPFKVLVANTDWSPAAALQVGNVIKGYARTLPRSPEGFLAETAGGSAAVFTRANVGKFIFVLPLDAFKSKNWGTGETRAGLIPTDTGCVRANARPTTHWMDGALTIQVVKSDTDASHVQANTPAAAGGYRLQDNATARAKLLAQYTVFWHRFSDCVGSAGWTQAPSEDTVPGTYLGAPSGDDPKGDFSTTITGQPSGGGGVSVTKAYYNNVEVTVLVSFSDQGAKITFTGTGGNVVAAQRSDFGAPQTGALQQGQKARLGRLGWKEVLR